MHIVVLADYAIADGGAPKVAIESARALAEAGVAVTYVHAVGDTGDTLLDHPNIERIGLELADVWSQPIHKAALNGIWNGSAKARLGAALGRVLRAGSIIHLHQWTKAFSPSVFSAIRESGAPLVATMHDYFIACPTGVFYRFDTHQSCGLKPLSGACLAARCDPRTPAHKAIRIARLIAQNQALKGFGFDVIHVSDKGASTVAAYLPRDVRQHRIDNPVSIVQRAAASRHAQGKALYLGRFTVEKGAVLAAEAARRAGMPALFVGEGPAEAAIRAANPDAEVRGWVPADQVGALIAAEARVLLAPSQWPETGPLTVYEAMATGVPVIGSTMSGAAEKIADGETGFIVQPEAAALADALRRMTPEVAQGMGAAAYARYWAKPPTPANHAAALIALYESIRPKQAHAAA